MLRILMSGYTKRTSDWLLTNNDMIAKTTFSQKKKRASLKAVRWDMWNLIQRTLNE